MFSHRWESAGRCGPAIWHKWNNSDGAHERNAGAKSPKNSQFFIPEPQEQEPANQPFRGAQKPSGPPDAENRIQPKNERAVADIGDQRLRLVPKPFLIAKK